MWSTAVYLDPPPPKGGQMKSSRSGLYHTGKQMMISLPDRLSNAARLQRR